MGGVAAAAGGTGTQRGVHVVAVFMFSIVSVLVNCISLSREQCQEGR